MNDGPAALLQLQTVHMDSLRQHKDGVVFLRVVRVPLGSDTFLPAGIFIEYKSRRLSDWGHS